MKKVENINESPKWYEEQYLKTLNKLRKELKQSKNPTVLMRDLITATYIYFTIEASEKNTPISESINDAYGFLSIFLTEQAIGKKLQKDKHIIAIGLLVEGLIYFGLPRHAAIEATSKWLEMGNSTVRTHNELYRERYPVQELKDSKKFEVHLKLSSQKGIIADHISKNPQFPCDHPKAKKAFLNLKNVVLKDPFRS